jgi:hypothetical protein
MKTNLLKTTIVFAVLIITSLNVKAQVTIGSLNEPQKGILLELKTVEVTNPTSLTDPDNETVDATGGGLGLPRVRLIDRNTLDPFIDSNNGQEWNDNAKLTHAGMVVYNIHVSDSTEKRANKIFSLGLYVWNGSEWSKIKDNKNDKKFFYMPSFCIELTNPGSNSFNLYAEYVKQFTKDSNPITNTFVSSNTDANFVNIPTHESGRLYTANELDFVVTYYDKNIMTINSIDTNGLMNYTIDNLNNLSEKSFINVVLVVR